MPRKCESESSLRKKVTLIMAFMSPPLYSQNDLSKVYILPWFPASCHPDFLPWPAGLSGLVHPNLSPNPSTPTALHAALQTLNFPVPQAHRGHWSVRLLVPGTCSLPLSVVAAEFHPPSSHTLLGYSCPCYVSYITLLPQSRHFSTSKAGPGLFELGQGVTRRSFWKQGNLRDRKSRSWRMVSKTLPWVTQSQLLSVSDRN